MNNATRLLGALLLPALLVLPACSKTSTGSSAAAAGSSAESEPFGRMSPDELQARMTDAKAGKLALFVYDNNEKAVYASGHLPGAQWVSVDDIKPSDFPAQKDATLVFYCANEH